MFDFEMDDYELDNELDDEMFDGGFEEDINDDNSFGFCEGCGSPDAQLAIDPYSDSYEQVHYCRLCVPSDFILL